MKANWKEKTVFLTKGLSATLRIERVGQQPPALGNNVVVTGILSLPCTNEKDDSLHPELQFDMTLAGSRYKLEGGHGKWWGGIHDGTRFAHESFDAPTWAKAEKAACEWCEASLQPLLDALQTRAQALENADEGEIPSEPESLDERTLLRDTVYAEIEEFLTLEEKATEYFKTHPRIGKFVQRFVAARGG